MRDRKCVHERHVAPGAPGRERTPVFSYSPLVLVLVLLDLLSDSRGARVSGIVYRALQRRPDGSVKKNTTR